MAKEKCEKCVVYRQIIKDLMTVLTSMVDDEGQGPTPEEIKGALERTLALLHKTGPTPH